VAETPPEAVVDLLAARAAARAARDWPAADALRDRIRTMGWDPVDGPDGSSARPWLAPADQARGTSLARPATHAASVVILVEDYADDLARLLDGLARHPLPGDAQLILVANAPAAGVESLLAAGEAVVVRSEHRLGWADAANLGMGAAGGAVVVLLDSSLEPQGDWLTPLLTAFAVPEVGLAGGWGVTSSDGRTFDEAPPGEVDAVEGYCLAVRREALRAVGGFDPRFRWYRNADLDLSFAIRAAGWRALRTAPLPLVRHTHRGWDALPPEERDRLSRRNFYRFLDHWRDRPDLLLHPGPAARRGQP